MRYLKRSAKPSSDSFLLGPGRTERDAVVAADRDVGAAGMGVGVVGVVGNMSWTGDTCDADDAGDAAVFGDVWDVCDADDGEDANNAGDVHGAAVVGDAGDVVLPDVCEGDLSLACGGVDRAVTTSSSEGGKAVSSSSK